MSPFSIPAQSHTFLGSACPCWQQEAISFALSVGQGGSPSLHPCCAQLPELPWTHPQDTRQPQLLVLFWFSCLKALAGQTGVWSWSLSHPGLAVPARVVVGQQGIAPLCPTARGRHLTPSRHHFGRGDQLSGTAIRPASARGTAR